MRCRKARRPTTARTAREPHAVFSSAKTRSREATLPDFIKQSLAVFDGQRCLGHVLLRGRAGVEAFDPDGIDLILGAEHVLRIG